ncbi:hypothetical protein CCHL11_05333 [Colletotrichum chlorophyti]|uniref:Polyamine transport protein n=1 Tax=Colletotrichum chlorophyti TaxID=708187 RepID=A0A1Q8RNT5_9PEZI|nr:hypothetical protein CCHL11_05333 [Colletotrichum chlorophyti]
MADFAIKIPEKDAVSSISSTRSGAFRHALLKTASRRPMIIEKELPVSPVLSGPNEEFQRPKRKDERNGYKDGVKVTVLSRKYSPIAPQDGHPLPDDGFEEYRGNNGMPTARERICADAILHPDTSPIKVHHRGFLKDVDFCDAEQPISQNPQAFVGSLLASSPKSQMSSEPDVTRAPTRPTMTGDGLCLSSVDVTGLESAHSHMTKVRPAFNLPTPQHSTVARGPQALLGVSKVRPFDPSKEHPSSERDMASFTSSDHYYGGMTTIPVSKVRTFNEEPPQLNHHLGHQPTSKVQPFNDNTNIEAQEDDEQNKYFAIGSNVSGRATRSKHGKLQSPTLGRSRAGTLDYKRTTQWLRDLLKTPEDHPTKLTEMPFKTKRASYVPLTDLAEHGSSSRRMTRQSTLPPSDVEPGVFQNTFGELERLLHEVLSLASQVADREETKSFDIRRPIYHDLDAEAPSDDCEAQHFSDIDLNNNRAMLKRAATFPNTGRHAVHDVRDVYRNISLTPRTTELENTVVDRTKIGQDTKTKRRHRSRSRQAAPVPEKISSKKKGKASKKIQHTKPKPAAKVHTDSDVCSMDGSDESSIIKRSAQYQAQDRGSGPAQPRGFSLAKSKRRQPIARDWSPIRKRAIATVACISTALVGMLIGIYAGLVPSLQYYIMDTSHATINGNVGCFLGMALPTFFCWPLPLMHGRKPYIMSSLILTMPLLFPQALAVSAQRFYNITG